MKKKLKMYVWEDVLEDYSPGMMCALATSPDHARNLLLKKCPHIPEDDLAREPKTVCSPEGFVVWGGG